MLSCHLRHVNGVEPQSVQQPPKATRDVRLYLFLMMRGPCTFSRNHSPGATADKVGARQPVMGVGFCISCGEMAHCATLSTRVDGSFCPPSSRERKTIETGTEAAQCKTKPKRPLDIPVTAEVSRWTRLEPQTNNDHRQGPKL